jgi:hypothetical protein
VKYFYLGNRSEWDTCTYIIFLLRMTGTMTFQNIDPSSRDTLYTGRSSKRSPCVNNCKSRSNLLIKSKLGEKIALRIGR